MKFEETKLTYLVNFLRSFLIYIQLGTLLLKREESKWNPGSSTYFLLIVYYTKLNLANESLPLLLYTLN